MTIRSKTFSNSTFLRGAKYDPSREQLVVQFRTGAMYRYSNVPAEIAESFFKTKQSASHFFRAYIRNVFQRERMDYVSS